MPFTPFNHDDFNSMKKVTDDSIPEDLNEKINDLRKGLGQFPELKLDFFKKRIVRRPRMLGADGLIFNAAGSMKNHWFSYIVGSQNEEQVQLNIAMCLNYIRVGLGFIETKFTNTKDKSTFELLQTFLKLRPPLPFRNNFHSCIERNKFKFEEEPNTKTADDVLGIIENHSPKADERGNIFHFIGNIWTPEEAITKELNDYRNTFLELMPFYEELILASGRYKFYPEENK